VQLSDAAACGCFALFEFADVFKRYVIVSLPTEGNVFA
jgi:hypothetical protein